MSVHRMLWLCGALLAASGAAAPAHQCAVCGKAIVDTLYLLRDQWEDQQKELCGQCGVLKEFCSLCFLPVNANGTSLPDGRFLCPRDAKIVVLEADRAREICMEAKGELDRLLAQYLTLPDTNVTLTIEDQVHMDQLLRAPGFERQCPFLLGYTRSRIVNDGRWRHSVTILSAQPAPVLMAVCAHEYAHTWLKENVRSSRVLDRDATEGFCEFIGYKLSEALHHAHEMQSIRKNTYSRGQIDLFLEADQGYGLYTILEWMNNGTDERLYEDDLDRIRRTEPRAPSTDPAVIARPPPQAMPTPVPDVLTLIGISGTGKGRLALINDGSFRERETAKVRVGTTNLTIECLEIRTNSVLIRVAGSATSEELKLRTTPKPELDSPARPRSASDTTRGP